MTAPAMRLRNSLTRNVESFAPLDPGRVRLYLCGPTVYDRAHLGNARNVILFDVLTRLLRHDYGASAVTYVRNVTDVDDKINARAAETGRSIRDITDETLGWFRDDMAALGCLPPDAEPRATDYVDQMIAMIATLVERGHAYAAEGHVLFAVASYEGYGALSGRNTDDMIAGARVEVAPFKRDPMDFVLWKPSAETEPGWESPWGRGRPGWHIECSAMARDLLGGAVDIHGGGMDLLFPHHENERAQSLCAHPDEPFARHWLHNEMLLVEGRKMSKSLGNFFTVRDLLDRGVPGEVIRFVFLSTHYSKPMDWTEAKADAAEMKLLTFHNLISDRADVGEVNESMVSEEVLEALRDDLNTHLALNHLDVLSRLGKDEPNPSKSALQLAHDLKFLGLFPNGFGAKPKAHWRTDDFSHLVEEVLAARREARAAKDWARADALRDALVGAGVVVTDGLGRGWEAGPGFDPAKLSGLP